MKLYKICFSTEHHDGGLQFHYPLVVVSKVKGSDSYRIKWDFCDPLDDQKNKSSVIHAESPVLAAKQFIKNELSFDTSVDFVGYSEIKV